MMFVPFQTIHSPVACGVPGGEAAAGGTACAWPEGGGLPAKDNLTYHPSAADVSPGTVVFACPVTPDVELLAGREG